MCETEPDSEIYIECTNEDICNAEEPIKWYIDEDDIDSLDNWVERLDLMCVPESKIELISSIYYAGEILGCIIISRVPDLFGRKWPLAIATTL